MSNEFLTCNTYQSEPRHHQLTDSQRWSLTRSTRHYKFPVIGQTTDVDGRIWNIRDVRTTKYGFDLFYGNPADDHTNYIGLPRLISTKPLYDFWDTNRLKGHGFLFDLPSGRTTLKRVRRRLGFNFHNDTDDFWLDRIDDLRKLPPREFAVKHDVGKIMVFDWRKKILGIRARPIGWWRTPETISLLRSTRTLREIGSKLNISTSQVHRLRIKAMQEPVASCN